MTSLRHLRSSTANKRPDPAAMVDGQLAMNYDIASPGLFFKDDNGTLIKVGPVHVGTTAPNVSPAAGGTAGNSVGEQWLDTTGGVYVLKVWDGSAWRSESGTFVDVSGDTMTGALTMANQGAVRFSEATANGSNYIALQSTASLASNKTITLPDTTGTVVTTGDTGTVTSTMIENGTILNADINASAAIAGTKVSPDFGSQTIATTGIFSSAAGTAAAPSIAFTGDINTGIYSPGADQLAVSTGGTGRLFIDSSGRVGIGTASPNANLHIAGPTAPLLRIGDFDNSRTINSEIRLNRAGGAEPFAKLSFYNGSASTAEAQIYKNSSGLATLSDVQVFLSAASSEYMRIDSSGRVGIGTSTPYQRMTVADNSTSVASGSTLSVVGGTPNTTGEGGSISLSNFHQGAVNHAARIRSGLLNAAAHEAGDLIFDTNGGAGLVERMRIRANGEVVTTTSFNTSFAGTTTGTMAYDAQSGAGSAGLLVMVGKGNDGAGTGGVSLSRSASSWASYSDERAKTNLVAISDGLSKVSTLRSVTGRYIDDEPGTSRSFLIAQDVQAVLPQAVDAGDPDKLNLRYAEVIPLLVAALKESKERIETLEAAVAALQGA